MDPQLELEIKQFRTRKEKVASGSALVMKVDKESLTVVLDELLEDDLTVDELRESLPESQPRFLLYSYVMSHDDGRTSYPLCFIFSTPSGCKMEMKMMYAGTKNHLVSVAQAKSHAYEVRDLEDLTEEWLQDKLKR